MKSPDTLGKRQFQILQYTCEGKSAKVIASELGLSSSTVETTLKEVRRKMGCISTAQCCYLEGKRQGGIQKEGQ